MKTNIMKSIRLKLLGLSFLFVAISSASYGDTFFFNGVLSAAAGSPTAHATGQDTTNSGLEWYNVFQITVTTSGTYTFELASLNTAGAGTSNALDTWLGIFTTTFTPPALGSPTASSDDFTGTLTVLPGPYAANGLTTTSTGFQGTQPGSRLASVSLTAGTTYYAYVSSFRGTTYVNAGTTAAASGAYYLGFSGTGALVVTPLVQTVPEPSTVALLGLGAIGALAVWRKQRAA